MSRAQLGGHLLPFAVWFAVVTVEPSALSVGGSARAARAPRMRLEWWHGPARDPFASGHGLPAAEGSRLEAIFAAARAAQPQRDIVVLSGDAHAHARWTSAGVTYLISGGGGGSPDATP